MPEVKARFSERERTMLAELARLKGMTIQGVVEWLVSQSLAEAPDPENLDPVVVRFDPMRSGNGH